MTVNEFLTTAPADWTFAKVDTNTISELTAGQSYDEVYQMPLNQRPGLRDLLAKALEKSIITRDTKLELYTDGNIDVVVPDLN
ncbi:hypothetical protein IV38_GL001173 [Lactobacillus selangorensis]|uniref:Uncharacterized protein n=1 Tax=Lactobacillus selangorensis TaxID=81857 RepID=A0A0R2FZH1_9LACO|nr:hypothetical protein [Lactobacillus selangorensis]KRN28960.1 hypothetical protein IV38_GL001173 [Lactobacillus selangorensis]KRN32630.1 hypothetical protein IV40_GL000680 [Lactobacillus selangorensis]